MSDFEKPNELLAEVWKLTDTQLAVLFEHIANFMYGSREFNEVVEQGLNKMKATERLEVRNGETNIGVYLDNQESS